MSGIWDRLYRGDGADCFYYDGGQDRIRDFNDKQNDRIYIDRDDILAGMSVAQMLRDKAEVINGDVRIDFGNGNTLTIDDISDKMSLVDDIQFY